MIYKETAANNPKTQLKFGIHNNNEERWFGEFNTQRTPKARQESRT